MKFYVVLLLIFVAFLLGLVSGRQSYKVINDASQVADSGQVFNKKVEPKFLSKDINFKMFWDAWKIIEDNYVQQPVSEPKLYYGAIAGSVAALGDPHSIFFDPETNKKFNDELGGSFEGIGAEVAIKKEQLTIVAPLPDSPAEKAGLKSGDNIYAIDGEDTAGMSLDYAVSKIRGPKGSDVTLSIARDGINEVKEYKLTRQKIQIQSVKWQMLDNNIVHLELRYFNEDTDADFNKAIMSIIAKNPKGIIFDLRNNPGGLLDTAINVASEWVDNKVVVFEKYSDGRLQEHKSTVTPRLKDFPTVVLINEGSASGSEIVAGALKDYKIANLVGKKSFGKGSVQSLFPLDDGSAIKLTIAQWLTPNENTIDGEGIKPDIEVELTEDDFSNDKDPQLDKAKEILQALIK
ncbi:MAG: S41 family peptidase [Candidatus Parcubacteria bacterium]|nr:S41 family peptidase [Candidatus Parcubacteria bacterium]